MTIPTPEVAGEALADVNRTWNRIAAAEKSPTDTETGDLLTRDELKQTSNFQSCVTGGTIVVSWKLRSDKEDVDFLTEVPLPYLTQEWWTTCLHTSEGASVAQQAVPQFYYTHLSAFQILFYSRLQQWHMLFLNKCLINTKYLLSLTWFNAKSLVQHYLKLPMV